MASTKLVFCIAMNLIITSLLIGGFSLRSVKAQTPYLRHVQFHSLISQSTQPSDNWDSALPELGVAAVAISVVFGALALTVRKRQRDKKAR